MEQELPVSAQTGVVMLARQSVDVLEKQVSNSLPGQPRFPGTATVAGRPACGREAGELPLLSVVVPVHNEEEAICRFDARLHAVLATMPTRAEVIYVNDGSTDRSLARLSELQSQSADIAVLDLSRNFGKEIALAAGLDHARGDAVVIIDADLQDPPELIQTLFAKWQEGFDNVYAQRESRAGDSWVKRATAHAFYRVLNRMSSRPVPVDTGDFRLLSRRAVDALCQLRERSRFMKGLYGWVGFNQVAVAYHRSPRISGNSSFNYWKLWNFSLDGITSFTTVPLRLISYLGLMIAAFSALYGVYIMIKTLLLGNSVAGYPSLIVIVLVLGGVQLLSLGIIGEYLGRLFDEAKARPLYFVRDFSPRRSEADILVPTGGTLGYAGTGHNSSVRRQ